MLTGNVVQFNEKHKWCGSFGIVVETKETENDVMYMVGVPIPEKGTAYIRVMDSDEQLENIGWARYVPEEEDDEQS